MCGKKLSKVFFISEIASTHNGSIKYLKKLTYKILQDNSDFIKFQIFKNKDLCHPSSKLYKGLKKIELSQKIWRTIIKKSLKKKGVILEPFDEESYQFCKIFKKKALIKISASEHDNTEMISDALKNFKKVFINISGFEIKKIKQMTSNFKKYKKKLILMYGFQSFPSKAIDLRLNIISSLKKLKLKTGYADHSLTKDKILTYLMTSKALDYGAEYIEKHITLSRAQKNPDFVSSFEPKDFKDYVNFFKKDYISKFNNKISLNEKKYCSVMEKFAFTSSKILKNTILNFKNVKFLRASQKGLNRIEIKNMINNKKVASKILKKNELIKKKHFRKK